jgi:hypothetical protein
MKEQIFRRFVGAFDERDEYQNNEIYKELAFSGIILYYFTMLIMVISLIIDTITNNFSIITPALILLNVVYAGIITYRLNKKQLDMTDCATAEEYEMKKKRLKRTSTFAGIFWGLAMILWMEYIMPLLGGEEVIFSWIDALIWLIGGIVFGVCIYSYAKSRLIKQYEIE